MITVDPSALYNEVEPSLKVIKRPLTVVTVETIVTVVKEVIIEEIEAISAAV